MNNLVTKLILGVIFTVIGVTLSLIYFLNIENMSIMLMVSSFTLLPIGLFLTNRSIATITGMETTTAENEAHYRKTISERADHPIDDLLNRNNEYIKTWAKSNKTREDLKLLQLAARAKLEKESKF